MEQNQAGEEGETKTALGLYQLEYQVVADRYQNIYNAIWSQFNYFAVAAAAVVALGHDEIDFVPLAILASLPFVLWYWVTFRPLNRYGDRTASRAREIEQRLNINEFGTCPSDVGASGYAVPRRGLHHFTDFLKDRPEDAPVGKVGRRLSIAFSIVCIALVLMAVICPPMSKYAESPWVRVVPVLLLAGVVAFLAAYLFSELLHKQRRSMLGRVRNVSLLVFLFAHLGVLVLLAILGVQIMRPEDETLQRVTAKTSGNSVTLKVDQPDLRELRKRSDAVSNQVADIRDRVQTLHDDIQAVRRNQERASDSQNSQR